MRPKHLRSRVLYILMVHSLVAKLFFIIFSVGFINIFAETPRISLSCGEIGRAKYLELNSPTETGLVVFNFQGKYYLVWDCGSEIPNFTIPRKDDWPPGFISIEKAQNIKTSKACLILCLTISTEMMPMVIKTEKGWAINAISEYLMNDNPNPNQVSFDHQKLGYMRIFNASGASSIVLNMPTGEELKVLATMYPDTGLDPERYEYVDIYDSVQGVCMYFKSDQIFMDKQRKDLALFPAQDPMMYSEKHTVIAKDPSPDITFMTRDDFTALFRDLLSKKTIDERNNRSLHLLEEAWVDLALCEGDEANQTVKLLRKEFPDFCQSLYYKIILGLSECLSEEYSESLKILNSLPSTPEINLWRNLCKIQLGQRVSFGKSVLSILRNYSINLRDYILVRLIPHLYESQQLILFNDIYDEKEIIPKRGLAKAVLDFYHAMYIFNNKDKKQGYILLEQIANNKVDYVVPMEFQTEASMEVYLYKNSDAPVDDIIKELDILRTQSKGNDIEVKICLRLIHQLEKKKNYKKIITIIEDLMRRFDKFDTILGLNQKLNFYIDKFFDQENTSVSPVKVISIFEKHLSLISKHNNYKKILERVIRECERLDLLTKATSLLTELCEKTTDEKRKVELQLKIARLYNQDIKPDNTIKFLSLLHLTMPEQSQQEAAQIISKAYLLKKNYQEAVKWLIPYPTKENKREIADIYISQENQLKIIDSLKDYLLSLKDREDDPMREIALVQLAAAYRLKKEFSILKNFYDSHKEFMQDRKSFKTFAMLCRPKAENLKTALEVREYIDDADAIKETLATTKSLIK